MSTKTYVLVANLKARQVETTIAKVEEYFKTKEVSLKVLRVKDPANINDYFKQALSLDPDVIVLGGGDGTLISGIEYLTLKNYQKPIGLLPLGTANYLARNLNIPLSIDESIERLLKGSSREIPIGVANDKFFALTFIVGLTQRVSDNVSTKLKRRFGQLAYIAELAKQTKSHEAFRYKIESDSLKKPITGRTHQIVVYNSDLNVQVKLVPDHDIALESLKVVVSRSGKSKFKLYYGFLVHIFTFGKIRPYMKVFKAKSLSISTDPQLPADYDGETYGKGPFDIHLYERKVHIIC